MYIVFANNNCFCAKLCFWFLGSTFFFFEYLLRVSPGVMLLELSDKFSITSLGLGLLSACFYYTYIIMQIPVGIMCDKLDIKRLMFSVIFFISFACILFSLSNHIIAAVISRLIMGFCSAFAFIGTVRISLIFFTPFLFSILTGITQSMGMLGAFFGEYLISICISNFNIEFLMLTLSFIFFFIAIIMFFLSNKISCNEKKNITYYNNRISISLLTDLKLILNSKAFWLNCLFISFLYGPTVVFAEMWGINFTSNYRLVSNIEASFAVSMIFLGMFFGCILFGLLNLKLNSLLLMRISSIASFLLMFVVIYIPNLNLLTLQIYCFIYGVFNSGIIPSYCYSTLLFNNRLSGVALGITNMFSILLGGLFIQVFGFLLYYYAPNNMFFCTILYQKFFIILMIFFIVSFIFSLYMKNISNSQTIARNYYLL